MVNAKSLCSALVLSLATVLMPPAGADDPGLASRRAGPFDGGPIFERVWVVERSTPELYEILTRLTSTDAFSPIVLAAGEGESTRAAEVNHLLEVLPNGDSHWVGSGPVPVGLNVDRVLVPWEVPAEAGAGARVVYCAERHLEPLAALAAMRLDGVLTASAPIAAAELVVQVGGEPLDPSQVATSDLRFVADAAGAVDLVNALAPSNVVLVFRAGSLLPEHVLYAFQREALLVEVNPPAYGSYDVQSEITATVATRNQIHDRLARLGFTLDAPPEALVVAGDWTQIPYRFARSLEDLCPGSDNGVCEHSADVEYANLDGDPWGEPEVPVGRLMSYDRDLLGLQAVIGVWKDHGGFPAAPRAAVLDLTWGPWSEQVLGLWRDTVPDRDWEVFGSKEAGGDFQLDREAFFAHVDGADLVLVRAHGGPNTLATLTTVQLHGADIAASATRATPAFWLVEACATARYLDPGRGHGSAAPEGNDNLLSAIQGRLAFGALLSVEVVSQASATIWWTTVAAGRGIAIGELVRRGMSAAVAAYHGQEGRVAFPQLGLSRPGSVSQNLHNAHTPMLWIGDPLTVFAPVEPRAGRPVQELGALGDEVLHR